MDILLLFSFAPQEIGWNIVLLLVGIAVVLWSADRLTDGAVGLAERLGVSQIVIGLTIVAMGTSMPEFCVSLISAIQGTPDLAVGNIVGSNIFNALLIVGLSAMVAPMTILPATVRKDIPFALVASILLYILCTDGTVRNITRIEAFGLFALFLIFMFFTLGSANKERKKHQEQQTSSSLSPLKACLLVLVGLVGLILGSEIFVDNATGIAHALHVSDAVIGLTVVAGGTSLPELATSVVAARRGNSGIAIGNVLGSNVFNILFILGITGMVCPMVLQGITTLDLAVMVISMILLWLFSISKYTISRGEGTVLTMVFFGYLVHLIINA